MVTGLVNQRNLIISDRLYGNQNTDNRSGYVQLDHNFWRINISLGGRYEQFVVNGKVREGEPVLEPD